MRLTKFNPETGLYEYKEPAKTQAEFTAQRKAVIQRLGEYEDKASDVAREILTDRTLIDHLERACGAGGKLALARIEELKKEYEVK